MSVFPLLQPLKMLITSNLQPDQPLLTVNSAGDSFVAVSWTLTPGWETALEGITSKVVSTNLNYMEGLTREENSWITLTPVKATISLEIAAPTKLSHRQKPSLQSRLLQPEPMQTKWQPSPRRPYGAPGGE